MRKIDLLLLDSPKDLISAFYNNELYLESTSYMPEDNFHMLITGLFNCLIEMPCIRVLNLLKENFEPEIITKANIPQFSNFDNCYSGVTTGILESGLDYVNYSKISYLLRVSPRKEDADKKYGENHAKIAAMFGFVDMEHGKGIRLTDFGRVHLSLNNVERDNLKSKLCLRIPLIKNYFCEDESELIV